MVGRTRQKTRQRGLWRREGTSRTGDSKWLREGPGQPHGVGGQRRACGMTARSPQQACPESPQPRPVTPGGVCGWTSSGLPCSSHTCHLGAVTATQEEERRGQLAPPRPQGPVPGGPAPAAGEHGVGTASCRLRLTGQCFPLEQGCERSLGTFTAVKGGWSALAGSEPPTAGRSRCDGVSLAPAFKASKQATPG